MFSERLIERLKKAYSIVALTGAGISAESGIPTFRGKDGLWNKYDPRELATREAFERDPQLVWEWYLWRRKLVKEAKPNLGHYALVDLEDFIQDFVIITQNVDALHQIAGSKRVLDLHGNLFLNKCFDCGKLSRKKVESSRDIPTCDDCGGLLRPGVVWFGEQLNHKILQAAQEFSIQCEIMFVVGTSAEVEPAASLPSMAKGNGSYIVEINPQPTPITSWVDESIHASAAEVLPALVVEVEKYRKRINIR
ncbi:MAG: NAD-dependent deacylase [Calditrichia bacterium]